jgi:ribonucleoside-triphosphate reductase
MSSTRAQVVTRRTYNRPLNEAGTVFETWAQTVDRVIGHQQWLWQRAKTWKLIPERRLHSIDEKCKEWQTLNTKELAELEELRRLLLDKKLAVAGRTLWLGGTPIAKSRDCSLNTTASPRDSPKSPIPSYA